MTHYMLSLRSLSSGYKTGLQSLLAPIFLFNELRNANSIADLHCFPFSLLSWNCQLRGAVPQPWGPAVSGQEPEGQRPSHLPPGQTCLKMPPLPFRSADPREREANPSLITSFQLLNLVTPPGASLPTCQFCQPIKLPF